MSRVIAGALLGLALSAAPAPAATPPSEVQLPPDPDIALAVIPRVTFTSPEISDGEARITSDELTLSGTIGHPGFRSVSVDVFFGGTRLADALTTCVLDCSRATDRSRSNFGPLVLHHFQLGVLTPLVIRVTQHGLSAKTSNSYDVDLPVRRVPVPDFFDLRALAIEATQGVSAGRRELGLSQPLDLPNGSMHLITNKPTVVRLYADARGIQEPLSGVSGRLFGERNGQPLPGSPLSPVSPATVPTDTRTDPNVSIEDQESADAGQTLNFNLPSSWLSGRINLHGEVNTGANPIQECHGCTDAGNDADARLNFTPGVKLRIAPWKFRYTKAPAGKQTNPTPLADFFGRVADMYPIAPGDLLVHDYVGTFEDDTNSCEKLLADLLVASMFSDVPGLRLGVLPENNDLCTTLSGFKADGVNGLPGSVSRMGGGIDPAHELGHNLGLPHSGCSHGEDLGGGCDDTYPVPHGGIDVPGFDLDTMTAISPGTPEAGKPHVHDLMSYGSPRWISSYTFEKLFQALKDRAQNGVVSSVPRASAAAASRRLVITGTIGPGNRANLDRIVEGNARPFDPPSNGAFELRGLDGAGQTVLTRRFAGEPIAHDGAVLSFAFSLPASSRIVSVAVLRGGQLLATQARSAAAPRVHWNDPRKARPLRARGTARVSWTASDADRNPLSYLLQFSRDGGRSWETLDSNIPTLSYKVDVSELPSTGNGRFRVVANDGFNGSADMNDRPIHVPNHAPDAGILSPLNHVVVLAGTDVPLEGQASDIDAGPGERVALHWSSSRDGLVGSGASVTLMRPSIGRHRITLRAVDRAGAAGTAVTTVDVVPATRGDRLPPRVLRARRSGRHVLVDFSEDVIGLVPGLRLHAGGRPVAVRIDYDSATREATLTPLAGVSPGAALSVSVTGRVTDLGGNRARARTLALP